MRVLIINTSDSEGGAARAANRLHKALLVQGVDSQMLVQSKASDDFTVIGPQNKFQKAMAILRPILDSIPVLQYKERSKIHFSPSWLPFSVLVEKINLINPDVVHLHWIAGGFIRIEELSKIKPPIVWSLHDNWAFTGGCHIMWDCDRYLKSCGVCPRLASKSDNDLSRKVWLRKEKTFAKLQRMKIIGLSEWLANCAKQSSLFKDHEVVCLPNPINTELYSPFNKNLARGFFNLPNNKKLIAFGAMSATSDINKGFKELVEALKHLSTDYELVIFGSSEPKSPQFYKQKAHYLGRLYDDVTLRLLYCAADVMVVPSFQENLSYAIMESLACGSPVVAFNVGGNSDLIDHKVNGYLALPYDIKDLAKGIDWVLNHPNQEVLSVTAREKVLHEFDSKIIANKYIDLYNSILSS